MTQTAMDRRLSHFSVFSRERGWSIDAISANPGKCLILSEFRLFVRPE